MRFLAIIWLLFSMHAVAQPGRDEALAASYLQEEAYNKAVELYQQLWEKSDYAPKFYAPYFKCLEKLKQYDNLEKAVKKQMKHFPSTAQYAVDLGYVYELAEQPAKAKAQFEKILKALPPNENYIRDVATAFEGYKAFDYAIQTYEKGAKMFNSSIIFAMPLAISYDAKGDMPNAAKQYITFVELQPGQAQIAKNTIMRSPNVSKLFAELETQLYTKIQRGGGDEWLNDFLIWLYIQNKDFEGAMQQTKAIDRRKNENGFRVLNMARTAQAEDFFDVAIDGFDYIIKKGKDNALYFLARTELLYCRKAKIAKRINFSMDDVLGLKNDYESFIAESGRGLQTAQSMKELAELEVFYLHNIPAAIKLCEELLQMNGVPQQLKNKTKLLLGDCLLIDGDMWESSLLYGQVDKQEKDSPLGEEARFKNAKLSYFKGDFEWAQTQLEVLKASTSELISNDAINLSVFIIDNSGLDSITTPLEMFAQAELLLYQNKLDEANRQLDSIKFLYPGHALYDDILYTQAKIFCDKRAFAQAVPLLEEIIKNYKSDLKGDDATFLLAEINEQYLGNKDKARELYQSIITDFESSLLVIEARKRFRILRGDKISE
ncbi:MAG: tetratricopeptide repeat protein [Chitinophagales bacterium]|nr:tetratricopeptide repeat protein [Chitinophagales bacterium]